MIGECHPALIMNKLDHYVHAATRDNTRSSYQSAVRHFEVECGGFLPATADIRLFLGNADSPEKILKDTDAAMYTEKMKSSEAVERLEN